MAQVGQAGVMAQLHDLATQCRPGCADGCARESTSLHTTPWLRCDVEASMHGGLSSPPCVACKGRSQQLRKLHPAACLHARSFCLMPKQWHTKSRTAKNEVPLVETSPLPCQE